MWVDLPCGPAMLRRKSIFWLKFTKFKLITHKLNVYMAGITSDLAKKSGDHLESTRRWSPGGLRTISAGTTLLVHSVF